MCRCANKKICRCAGEQMIKWMIILGQVMRDNRQVTVRLFVNHLVYQSRVGCLTSLK